jgi:hypothetical protein
MSMSTIFYWKYLKMNKKEVFASVVQIASFRPQTTHGRNHLVSHYNRLINTMVLSVALILILVKSPILFFFFTGFICLGYFVLPYLFATSLLAFHNISSQFCLLIKYFRSVGLNVS